MDSYKAGYLTGRYVTRAFVYLSSAKLAVSGYCGLGKIAKAHKINCNDAVAVSDNLLKCIELIDW